MREGSKTSDAKRRRGGQMREGSGRAGKGCEARERANRGPCFTNCHLRGANGGMREKKKKIQQPQTGSRLHTARDVLGHLQTLHHAHMGEHTHTNNTNDSDTGRQKAQTHTNMI